MPIAVLVAVGPADARFSDEMTAVAATRSSTEGLGFGTLLLALVVGLLGFALLLLLILLSDRRGRQLLVAARAVWTLGIASIRERRLPESALRAETRRCLVDALQDLRSVVGDEPTARQLAERAAWDEHAAREDASARERARVARERAREKAAARVAETLRRAQQQAAEARAARESVERLEAELADLPAADAGRFAAAIEAVTARLLAAQQAAAAAEERAAVEITAAEQAVVARAEAEAAIVAAARQAAAEQAAAQQAAAARAEAEAAIRAAAEQAAAERAAAERAAAQQAAAARAEAEAAIRAAAEQAAAQQSAAEEAAAQAAAEQAMAQARLQAVEPSTDEAREMTPAAEVEIDVRETARLGAATGPAGGGAGLRLVEHPEGREQESASEWEVVGPPEDPPSGSHAAKPRTPGRRARPGRPVSAGNAEHRRVVTTQVLESGPVALVPAVEEPAGARPPVSWQMARGAPLVGSTGTTYRRGMQVERTRRRLIELRQNDARSIRRVARQSMAARIVLFALVPCVALWRALSDPGFPGDVVGGRTGLLVALSLAVAGSGWAWRVTCPPFALLRRPSAKGESHLLRSLLASEQLAVRLAAGAKPSDAWRSVAASNHFPVNSALPAASAEGALALAEQSRRTALRRRLGPVRRRVAVTVAPVLLLLLPAVLLLVIG